MPKTTMPTAIPIKRIWLNSAHSAETSGDWANADGTVKSEQTAITVAIPDIRKEMAVRKMGTLVIFGAPKTGEL